MRKKLYVSISDEFMSQIARIISGSEQIQANLGESEVRTSEHIPPGYAVITDGTAKGTTIIKNLGPER